MERLRPRRCRLVIGDGDVAAPRDRLSCRFIRGVKYPGWSPSAPPEAVKLGRAPESARERAAYRKASATEVAAKIWDFAPWLNQRPRRIVVRMKIRDMMTKETRSVSPDTPVVEAAGLMRLHDIGFLPVLEGRKVVGMITDRDIVIQVVADGEDPRRALVKDAMSTGSISIEQDRDVDEAVELMQKYQVRRLPVLDAAGDLVGIVSLGDIAVDVHTGLSGKVLKVVSEPAVPRL